MKPRAVGVKPRAVRRKIKRMYVWEDVLTDYTSGLVCVLAYDEPQARQLLALKDTAAARSIEGIEPKVITRPEAFCVWGGG